MKDLKAEAKPSTSRESSVCPDPDPVPGFQPRSTWMAGQRASASPTPSAVAAQVRELLGKVCQTMKQTS